MAGQGRLGPGDGLCVEGGQAWEQASQVPGVFGPALDPQGAGPGQGHSPPGVYASGGPGYAPDGPGGVGGPGGPGGPGYAPGGPGGPGGPGYAPDGPGGVGGPGGPGGPGYAPGGPGGPGDPGYAPGGPGGPGGPGYAPGGPGGPGAFPPGGPGYYAGGPGYAPGGPGGVGGPGGPGGVLPGQIKPPKEGGIRLHISRAFAWDLRSMKVTSAEADALRQRGIQNDALHKFLAWRRSILLYVIAPTSLSALLALLGLVALEWSTFTGFGVLVQLLWAASLAALPVAALLASRCWYDVPRSRRFMTVAWAFSFLLPIGVSLMPARWVFEMGSAPEEAQVAANFLVGIVYFLNLLPLVLSLMPGLLRVSIRVKALLPESIMPGWFTMAAAPFYSLLLLVAFVLILQIAGNAVLLLALAGLVVAPLVFVLRGRLFVRPILTDAQRKSFAAVQVAYSVVVGVSVCFLLVFFLTGKVGAMPIVGDEGASMMTYGKFFWQVFKFMAEFTGRSLFITAVAVDYFLMMNLSVWQNVKSVELSDHAASYDELMGNLGQVLGGPGKAE